MVLFVVRLAVLRSSFVRLGFLVGAVLAQSLSTVIMMASGVSPLVNEAPAVAIEVGICSYVPAGEQSVERVVALYEWFSFGYGYCRLNVLLNDGFPEPAVGTLPINLNPLLRIAREGDASEGGLYTITGWRYLGNEPSWLYRTLGFTEVFSLEGEIPNPVKGYSLREAMTSIAGERVFEPNFLQILHPRDSSYFKQSEWINALTNFDLIGSVGPSGLREVPSYCYRIRLPSFDEVYTPTGPVAVERSIGCLPSSSPSHRKPSENVATASSFYISSVACRDEERRHPVRGITPSSRVKPYCEPLGTPGREVGSSGSGVMAESNTEKPLEFSERGKGNSVGSISPSRKKR